MSMHGCVCACVSDARERAEQSKLAGVRRHCFYKLILAGFFCVGGVYLLLAGFPGDAVLTGHEIHQRITDGKRRRRRRITARALSISATHTDTDTTE